MKTIAIIGFGAFGQAVAKVLLKTGQAQVRAWDVKNTGHDCQVENMSQAVIDADMIFFAVPSKFFASCIESLGQVPENAILLTGTKGMDPQTNKLPFEILKEHYPKNPLAVLSGPMLAGELNEGLPTTATIASEDELTIKKIQEIFQGSIVSLEPSSDILGTALLGVLKNVYVLALGASDGLEMGSDVKAILVHKAQEEMEVILKKLGANPDTIETPAGEGDFLATGYSTDSRNYTFGFSFAKGVKDDESKTVEGIDNIKNIQDRVGDVSDLPFFLSVKRIFLENANAKDEIEGIVRS